MEHGIRTKSERELHATLVKAQYRGLSGTTRMIRREMARRAENNTITQQVAA